MGFMRKFVWVLLRSLVGFKVDFSYWVDGGVQGYKDKLEDLGGVESNLGEECWWFGLVW